MPKRGDSIQWWDRGRDRWRSRPENKARSYDEPVGGKRRPQREVYRPSRCAVRTALAHCHTDDDEGALDRAIERSDPRWTRARWKHTSTRARALARKRLRRAYNRGRKNQTSRPWFFPSAWLPKPEGTENYLERYERLAALARRAREVFEQASTPWRRHGPYRQLADDPLFRATFPHGWRRRSIARRCIAALARRRYEADRLATLRSIIEGSGKFAPMFAVIFAIQLGSHEVSLWLELRAWWHRGYDVLLERELAKDPALDAALRAWIARHLPTEHEAERLFEQRADRINPRWRR
jgi:hypothetical protein